jgi:hypothetical protein
MRLRTLLLSLLALIPCAVFAAGPKVAFTGDSPALRAALEKGGAQIVDAPGSADVLVIQSDSAKPVAKIDRAIVEAAAKRGAGIVLVGSAMENGEWLKPVTGGAWTEQSRKFSSLMMLFPLTDAHAITRDASAFDITDETSYDLDLDPAINVLGSAFSPKVTGKKRDDRAPEKLDRANVYDVQPQMWTFEGADGHRAFVILQGNAETLKHASIRTFILRGIAWAAKRANADELCSAEDLATLRYPAGGPRRAEDTVKSFEMMPGFAATAIASEPLINKPIAMQFDAKGRLWIAETPEYPNGRRPSVEPAWKETGVLKPGDYDRPATDRISILSEPDANGKFTRKTAFYSGLELVTGFCLYRDGFIAVGQPDIIFVHGEGAAQKVERLYTGFTPGDTHFVANHFMVAPDGWIYANTGSGPNVESVAHPEVKARLSSGVFRFKPDGTAIEQVGSKGGNAFGMDITSEGEIFAGQATSGNPVQHVVLPEEILAKGKVGTAGSMESVIKGRKVVREDMPTRVPYMQIDVVGGYSSATASTVYEGGAWPAVWNRTVFCTEPILDIIHAEKLKPEGVTFTGEMNPTDREWLRARDFWFFPVDVQFGPDGAMYVLDFYNPIVAHSDTRGPKHSRAGASVRPDREHYFGRIYRIQNDHAKKLEALDLTTMNAASLVKEFTHPNKGVRFNAQRLLMDREDAAGALPELKTMAVGEKFAPARILALWSLERLGKLEPQILQTALKAEDADIRKSALLIVEELGAKNTTDISALLNDAEPRVRLLALRAMASSPLSTETAAALLAVLPKLGDDWSRSAATAAASSNAGPMLLAALASHEAPSNTLLDLAKSLASTLTDKNDAMAFVRFILATPNAASATAPLTTTVLEAAGAHLPAIGGAVSNPDNLSDALTELLASKDTSLAASALPIAAAWDLNGKLKPVVAEKVKAFLALASDAAQPDAARSAAARGLVRVRATDAGIVPAITALLKTKLSDTLAADIIASLLATEDDALGKSLVALLPNLTPLAQTALYDGLASRSAWANAVLDALQAKDIKPALLGPARLSKLRMHPDPSVAKRALKVINEVGAGTNAAKDETIAKLLPLIESKAGDAAKGKVAFTAACAICHRFNNDGKEVGPVLDGIGVQGTNELLISIIDPSRVVDNEHRTWSIALKNGTFAVGIIARENDRTLTLHLPGGISQDIKMADIKSRQDTGLSLMPEGLEALGADTLRDILAYLRGSSGKFRAVNLGTSFTTDTGGGLYNSREAKNDTIQPVKYGVVTVEGVPFSLPDPSTTPTGGNVIVLKNGDGKTFASTMPQRVEIPVGFSAGNLHFLSGVAGWGGNRESHKPAMKVTIEHAGGKKQVEELFTGDVFIDYVSGDEVPGSKRAEGVVQKHHVRYFSLPVHDRAPIKSITLESYGNGVSPTTLAITADTGASIR